MRIQTQNNFTAPVARKPAASTDERAPQFNGQDMLLLNRIESQEKIIRASYTFPWAGAVVGAASGYYLAKTTILSHLPAIGNHPGLWSGGLGLPVGLLLGAGLAEYFSTNAAAAIEEAESQLTRR